MRGTGWSRGLVGGFQESFVLLTTLVWDGLSTEERELFMACIVAPNIPPLSIPPQAPL